MQDKAFFLPKKSTALFVRSLLPSFYIENLLRFRQQMRIACHTEVHKEVLLITFYRLSPWIQILP
jgi:hypothetical protein